MANEFCLKMPDFHVTFRDLLRAVNIRHGTNGFTSLPKEGVLRIFFSLKNPTFSAGFEPSNLGTKGQHATFRPPKPHTSIGKLLYLTSRDSKDFLGGSWSLKMGPLGCPETSVGNFHYSLRNNPEEGSSSHRSCVIRKTRLYSLLRTIKAGKTYVILNFLVLDGG